MLPLGEVIPAGAFVRIDEKEPIRLAYTTCDIGGCYAEAPSSPPWSIKSRLARTSSISA